MDWSIHGLAGEATDPKEAPWEPGGKGIRDPRGGEQAPEWPWRHQAIEMIVSSIRMIGFYNRFGQAAKYRQLGSPGACQDQLLNKIVDFIN